MTARAGGVAVALAVALVGCGASHRQRTVTETEKQAAPGGLSTAARSLTPKCQHALTRQSKQTNGQTVVIDCGHGLTTNGSCDFARAVKNAYVRLSGESGLVVRTNPLRCTPSSSGWTCRSTISQVYVTFRAAAP